MFYCCFISAYFLQTITLPWMHFFFCSVSFSWQTVSLAQISEACNALDLFFLGSFVISWNFGQLDTLWKIHQWSMFSPFVHNCSNWSPKTYLCSICFWVYLDSAIMCCYIDLLDRLDFVILPVKNRTLIKKNHFIWLPFHLRFGWSV